MVRKKHSYFLIKAKCETEINKGILGKYSIFELGFALNEIGQTLNGGNNCRQKYHTKFQSDHFIGFLVEIYMGTLMPLKNKNNL